MVPFVENNFNIVELGPRGTGKSHLYQQISPYSHLISGGKATVAKMFVNNANGQRGLVCHYDVVCFDEINLNSVSAKSDRRINMTEEALVMETKQSPWWLVLIGGILNIIVGILLLTAPAKTTAVLVFVLGIYWLISGIFILVGMFEDHSAWGWKLFMGIISILAGLAIIIANPLIAAFAVAQAVILVLGIQGIIVGVIMLVMAFRGGGWGAGILGVLGIIFGIALTLNWTELSWIISLVWVVGIFAIVGGILQIVQAFRQRSA